MVRANAGRVAGPAGHRFRIKRQNYRRRELTHWSHSCLLPNLRMGAVGHKPSSYLKFFERLLCEVKEPHV